MLDLKRVRERENPLTLSPISGQPYGLALLAFPPYGERLLHSSISATHLAAYISPFGRACESLRSFGEGEIFHFRYCKANHASYLEAPFGFAPCNNGTAEPGPRAFRLRRGSLRKRLLPQASIRTPQLLAYYWLWRVTDATLQAERPLGLSRLQRVNIISGSYVTFGNRNKVGH